MVPVPQEAEGIAREIGSNNLAVVLQRCRELGLDGETLLLILYGRLMQRHHTGVLSYDQVQAFEQRLGLSADTYHEWRLLVKEAL